jgi:hypothetical protein
MSDERPHDDVERYGVGLVEPGRRARMVTLVEQLPAGVEITEVVHTVVFHGSGSERLVFSVKQ